MMENTTHSTDKYKAGVVTLVGRPNVGKSTLLNTIIGLKVAITSPRPQTTRFPVRAVLNEDRGQIVFTDTPGMFAKHEDSLSAGISQIATSAVREDIDVLLYVVDVSRSRGLEENRILGLVRKSPAQKILVMNKMDKGRTYRHEYEFLRSEFEHVLEVSALETTGVKKLVSQIFELLPERGPVIPHEELKTPLINIDRRLYLEELIREKVFLNVRQEIPYSVTVRVTDIVDKGEDLYVTADVVTAVDRYKGFIIGKKGATIKAIGKAVRKELDTITHRKTHLDLEVVVDPHWVQEWL